MVASDWIAIASAVVAVAAFVYAWQTNTKRYELTDQYRKDVLEWFNDCVNILIKLKLLLENNILTKDAKCELLSSLSANIETGRFFFPNVDKGDSFGEEKPLAYRGYRHIILEFLVFSYEIFDRDNAKDYLMHIEELQRHFTSQIFDLLDPKNFNKLIKKHTGIISENVILEEFLNTDPKTFDFYK